MQTIRMPSPWLNILGYFCLVSAVVLCAYILMLYRQPMPYPDVTVRTPVPTLAGREISIDLKDYQDYESVFVNRDLFSLTSPVKPVEGVAQSPQGKLPEHLKVVGVVIGKPVQVILEDTAVQRTYFISQDRPEGGVSIVSVQDKTIIINYQGQFIPINIHENTAVSSDQKL